MAGGHLSERYIMSFNVIETLNMKDRIIERISIPYLEQVRKMANRSLRETYTEELFSHFFENFRGCFLVSLVEGELVGFLLAVPKDETSLRVLMLVVEERYQRMGLGRDMIEAAEGYASSRKMGSIVLEVGTENHEAVGFYNRMGFKIVGILSEYYEDRTDAFIMRKILPS